MESLIHLACERSSAVISIAEGSCAILHWGARLPPIPDPQAFLAIAADGESWGEMDHSQHPGLWREAARGFHGEPTLDGHRDGHDWSPLFTIDQVEHVDQRVVVTGLDASAGLRIRTTIQLHPSGVLEVGHVLTNQGSSAYTVNALMTWLPLPDRASEVLDFTGRWVKERQPQRHAINVGTWSRQVREGRSGHDGTIVQLALAPGTGFRTGEVWSVGLQWSGNGRFAVERTPVGRTSIGAGESLLPGEVRIEPGQSYQAPPVASAYSDAGLDGVTAAYLQWLRSRPGHPTAVRPRPLTLNVWEAVWFDHDLERLTSLMDVAAEIGVERFVLDDGWFHLRRDDWAGLGDWWVDPEVWPAGLGELIRRVHDHGMEFGLWFEPEMVNVDSDLYRAHPDWVLHVGDRLPPAKRHQQVLNIAHPDAWQYIYDCMHALLNEYDIAYIKWDHNRGLVDPGGRGRAMAREQTLAFYRLVDALKAAHPGLEIESCASGGGRIDLGVVHHCDRFWTSDCNEALERQFIQRWTGIAIPPELLGTHIGPPHSHSTGREHSLAFRATTALFGHAGIEWDISTTTDEERRYLRAWADYYRASRDLLHGGSVVRVDGIDPAALVHGVVASDQSRALFAYVQMTAAQASKPDNLLLAGLDPNQQYQVRMVEPAGPAQVLESPRPAWADGIEVSGEVLMKIGLRPPRIVPESAILIEVTRC